MESSSIIEQLRTIEGFAELEGARNSSAESSTSSVRIGGEVGDLMRTDGASPHLLLAVIEAATQPNNTSLSYDLQSDIIQKLDTIIAQIRAHISQVNSHIRKFLMHLARNGKLAVVRANIREKNMQQLPMQYCAIARELDAQVRNLIEMIPLSTSATHRIHLPKLEPICADEIKPFSSPPDASHLQKIVCTARNAHETERKYTQLLGEFKKMDAILDIINTQCIALTQH